MQIILNQCEIAVGDLPQVPGGKVLQFVDAGIMVTVPLPPAAVAHIAQALQGQAILPANALPLRRFNGNG